MKKIVCLFLLNLLVGCIDSQDDCIQNPIKSCPCNLDCPENYTCMVDVNFEMKSSTEECVLGIDLKCKSNSDCPKNSVCNKNTMMCDEPDCIGYECPNGAYCVEFYASELQCVYPPKQ